MKLRICLLTFFTLFICCHSDQIKKIEDVVVFDLNVLPKTTQICLSELGFVDIKYVPLETMERCIIERIYDIKVNGNSFIIHSFNSILKFDNKGCFQCEIGKLGRGPGEFVFAHEIDIDEKTQSIFLVDGWARKFYVYSEKGEFLRTFNSPMNTLKFRLTNDGILCYSTNYIANVDTSFVLIDTDGHVKKSFANRYPWHYKVQQGTAVFEENLFYKVNNRILKKEVYCDTVFLFENKCFLPYLVIRHGDKLLTTKARSELSPELLLNDFFSQKRLFEFGEYLYYEFGIGFMSNNRYSLIGSKKTGREYLINTVQGLINDLDGGPNIWPKTTMDDNTILTWIDAIDLKKHVASEAFRKSKPLFPEKKQELEKLANSLKETDNPVLVLVRLKK